MRKSWEFFDLNNSDLEISECGIHNSIPSEKESHVAAQTFVLHFVSKGSGVLEVNQREYNISENQGFIIRKGQKVTYYGIESNPCTYYWIGLSGRKLFEYLDRTTITLETDVITFSEDSAVKKVIVDVCEAVYLRKPFVNDLWLTMNIYKILFYLIEEFPKVSKETNFTKRRSLSQTALDLIHENIPNANFTINEIAQNMKITRGYLYRIFKATYSISPRQYLLQARMEKARQYLINTDEAIGSISENVGYKNQFLFSKAFKKFYDLSPSDMRKDIHTKLIHLEFKIDS